MLFDEVLDEDLKDPDQDLASAFEAESGLKQLKGDQFDSDEKITHQASEKATPINDNHTVVGNFAGPHPAAVDSETRQRHQ
jgi:hypothetical protein